MQDIHSKVVADLIKYMNRLPHPEQIYDKMSSFTLDHLKIKIGNLVKDIDKYAELDAKGWIK